MPNPGGSGDNREVKDPDGGTDVYQVNADGTDVAPVPRGAERNLSPGRGLGEITAGDDRPEPIRRLSSLDTDPRIPSPEENTNPSAPIPTLSPPKGAGRLESEKDWRGVKSELPWDQDDEVPTSVIRTVDINKALAAAAPKLEPSAPQQVGRKGTVSQMPAQSAPMPGAGGQPPGRRGTVGQMPAQSDPPPAPRKPTRAEVPAASGAPKPIRRATAEEIPAAGAPAPRRMTSAEARAPGVPEAPRKPTSAEVRAATPAGDPPRRLTSAESRAADLPRRNSKGEVPAAIEAATAPAVRVQTPKPVADAARGPARTASPQAAPLAKPAPPRQLPLPPPPGRAARMEDQSTNLFQSLEDLDSRGASKSGSQKMGERLKSAMVQLTGMRSRLPSQMTGITSLERGRRGMQLVIACGMLLVGIAGVFYALVKHVEQPPLETLQILYPYGLTGRRMPNGRLAPPATEVLFSFRGVNDCGVDVCEVFDGETTDKSFHIVMNVRKTDGEWVLDGTSGPRE